MAVPFSNTKLRVPKGFQNVLEGLAREVLRCQPDNIYSFSAAYFEELLRKRQETGFDDITLLGAKLEDRFYNNHSFKNPNVNTNNGEQQSAAVVIQSEYRRFAAKKEVDSLKEEEAATVIQASFRGHVERNTVRTTENSEEIVGDSLIVEDNVRNQSTIAEDNEEHVIEENQNNVEDNIQEHVIETNQNNVEENIQEPLIETNQSNIEDNLQIDDNTTNEQNMIETTEAEERTDLVEINEDNEKQGLDTLEQGDAILTESPKLQENEVEVIDIDLEDPDVEKAALKIQSVFKGFKSRRKNEDQKKEEPEGTHDIVETVVKTTEEEVADKPEDVPITDSNTPRKQENEEIDIDLQDPEVEKAALKIQSVFKGFSGRKRAKSNKEITIDSGDVQDVVVEQNLITEEIEEESKIEVSDDAKVEELGLDAEQQNIIEENNIDINLTELEPISQLEHDEENHVEEKENIDGSFGDQEKEETEKTEESVEIIQENVGGDMKEIENENDENVENVDTNEIEKQNDEHVEVEDKTETIIEESVIVEVKDYNVEDDNPTVAEELTNDISADIVDELQLKQEEEISAEMPVEENAEAVVEENEERELEPDATEIEQTDLIKEEENEDDTAMIADDVVQLEDTVVVDELGNSENNPHVLVKENIEEVTIVDTDVADTSRTIDGEQEEDQTSDRQNPTSHLVDSEDNVDAEPVTSFDETARSEEPDDQA